MLPGYDNLKKMSIWEIALGWVMTFVIIAIIWLPVIGPLAIAYVIDGWQGMIVLAAAVIVSLLMIGEISHWRPWRLLKKFKIPLPPPFV